MPNQDNLTCINGLVRWRNYPVVRLLAAPFWLYWPLRTRIPGGIGLPWDALEYA